MNELPDYVREYISRFAEENDYEYADNFRGYPIENPTAEQVAAYNEALSQGCCGYYDQEHTINGEQWMIGFNYGH